MRDCEACRLKVERALDDDEFYDLKSEVFKVATETDSSFGEPAHLDFEQTAAYVDGTLTGEEFQEVEDHLTGCQQCVMAVNDLLAFKKQVSPDLKFEYQPPQSPAVNENRWRQFVAVMASYTQKRPTLVVGSVFVTLLLFTIGWLIWRAMGDSSKDPKSMQTFNSPTPPVVSPGPAQTPATAKIIAQLNDGVAQLKLDGDGKLSGVDRLPPAYEQMIKNALASQRLDKSPLLAGLIRPDSLLRKGVEKKDVSFSLIDPIGIVLLSDRPTFRWSPLDGATAYTVEVFDEKLNQVISSPQLTETAWGPPRSLQRGHVYSWQVTALKGGEDVSSPRPPAPMAKFRILDEALANEVIQARRDYASTHLMLALIYSKAGLLEEAEREIRALQRANPNSPIPSSLLANLNAMRR